MGMCGMCRHAKKGAAEPPYWGTCHRFPPQSTRMGTSFWPDIHRTDSCGEFAAPKRATKGKEVQRDLG